MDYKEIQEALKNMYLYEDGYTFVRMAKESKVSYHTIRHIVNEEPSINCTQKTILKLERFLKEHKNTKDRETILK